MNKDQQTARRQMRILLSIFGLIITGLLLSPYAHHTSVNQQKEISKIFLKKPLPAMDSRLDDVTFVAFDTETTGVNPNYERIVEIAAVKFLGGEIIEQTSWLLNPEQPIPQSSQAVHGITPAMVADKPTFKDVYPEFAAFIAGSMLTAHNANFDVQFVRMEVERAKLPQPPNQVFDSLRLFRKLIPSLESYSLGTIAKHVNIDAGTFHRAEDDAVYVAAIINQLLEKNKPAETLGELLDLAGGTYAF